MSPPDPADAPPADACDMEPLATVNVPVGLYGDATCVGVLANGALLIEGRDAVQYLFKRGSLNARQFDAARRYQTLYELTDPSRGLAPPELGGVRGGSMSEAFAERLVRTKRTLGQAQLTLLGVHPLAPAIVEAVVGNDRAITKLFPQRRARERALETLRGGLDALAMVWGID